MKILVSGGFAPSLILFRKNFLEALVKAGHHVTACAAEENATVKEQLNLLGVKYIAVGVSRSSLNPFSDLIYFLRFSALIRKIRPNISFSYTHKPVIYTSLAARVVCRKCRCFAMITGLGLHLSDRKLSEKSLSV